MSEILNKSLNNETPEINQNLFATKEFVSQLEEELFNDTLSASEYLEILDDLESHAEDYSYSHNVLESLQNEKIKEKLFSVELNSKYYELLTLVNFHLAREAGFSNKNENAINYCNAALEANKTQSNLVKFVTEDQEFTQYLQGTKEYFEGNIDALQSIIDNISASRNKDILTKLYNGLLKRGQPDYYKDLET